MEVTMKTLIAPLVCSSLVVLSGTSAVRADTPPQHAKLTQYQNAERMLIAAPAVIPGSSAKLTRDDDGIWMRVNTTGLPAGAYTNWWVIYNNPDKCDLPGSCAGGDLANPAVEGAVIWATGGVVGRNGVGHFSARLDVGEIREMDQVFFIPGTLQDASKAAIQYVLKYHGPVEPLILDRQLTTSFGGCIGGTDHPNDPDYPLFFCYDPQITPVIPGR
jgi:hypothetical protein